MKTINTIFNKLPAWISSKISIFIYLFLFFYLVIFALLCVLIPSWNSLMPSDNSQLIFGNYTNVLSALGASIAAGSGISIHNNIQLMHRSHKKLVDSINQLHERLDKEKQNNTDTKTK